MEETTTDQIQRTPEYRIIRAFAQLPYACDFRYTEGGGKRTVTMDDIAHNLDKLVEWFEKDRESRAALGARLMRYEGAMAGLANFLDLLDEVRS
jgi:hypothetical protein